MKTDPIDVALFVSGFMLPLTVVIALQLTNKRADKK